MRGLIEQVWENEARSGQKYLTVQIDGERYSLWDTKYFDHVQEGLQIEYEVRKSGNCKHFTEITPVKEQERPVYRPNGRDIQIARLSCLKSASEIVSPVHMDIDSKQEMVIKLAKWFERYVFEDNLGAIPHQESEEWKRGSRSQNQDRSEGKA